MTINDLKQKYDAAKSRWTAQLQRWETQSPQAYAWGRRGYIFLKWSSMIGFGLLLLIFLIVRLGIYRPVPSYEEIRKIQNPIASEVYSADSVLLGRYFIENRTNASIREIPEYISHALVATEDSRFYKHRGIDTRSLFRVLFKSLLLGDASAGGGSTVSQQLAKNIYGRKTMRFVGTPLNKIWEMIVARRLEKTYSKPEILELYFNTVSFGEEVYGIETASERYFNTKPQNLRIQDGAILIGMLKATTSYNPKRNPENAKARRNVVFEQMVKMDFLEKEKLDSLKALPVELDYNYTEQRTGFAQHFREMLRLELEDFCKTNYKSDGSPYDLYTDGLRIYTTIDSRMQQHAEAAVLKQMEDLQRQFDRHWGGQLPWGKTDEPIRAAMRETQRYKNLEELGWSDEKIEAHFKEKTIIRLFTYKGEVEENMSPWDSIIYYHQFLNTAFLAMRPQTGEIKAYVGSISFKHFPYDHVWATRQVGSVFKPVVYAAALENGRSICDFYPNEKFTYPEFKDWSPGNSDGTYGGYYSLKGGLTHSINTIAAQLMQEVGISAVKNLAKKMGVKAELPYVASLSLGTAEISLYEMLKVYGTFANDGRPVEPTYIVSIEDKLGNVLKSFEKGKVGGSVLSKSTVSDMIKMMQSVVDNGTASRMRYRYGVRGAVAGKTGTTQEQADGWFMGFTPDLVAGAWVGGRDRTVRFRTTSMGDGASTALPIWSYFMNAVREDSSIARPERNYFRLQADSNSVDCPLIVRSLSEVEAEESRLQRLKDANDESLNMSSAEEAELETLMKVPADKITAEQSSRLNELLEKERKKEEREAEREARREARREKLRNVVSPTRPSTEEEVLPEELPLPDEAPTENQK